MHDLVDTAGTFLGRRGPILDGRQDRIVRRLESLGNECRADGSGRISASERDHPPAKLTGDRRGGQQVACKIDEIVAVPETSDRETGNRSAFYLVQPGRQIRVGMPANAAMPTLRTPSTRSASTKQCAESAKCPKPCCPT